MKKRASAVCLLTSPKRRFPCLSFTGKERDVSTPEPTPHHAQRQRHSRHAAVRASTSTPPLPRFATPRNHDTVLLQTSKHMAVYERERAATAPLCCPNPIPDQRQLSRLLSISITVLSSHRRRKTPQLRPAILGRPVSNLGIEAQRNVAEG
jgi:hypothetical protein